MLPLSVMWITDALSSNIVNVWYNQYCFSNGEWPDGRRMGPVEGQITL